MFNSVPFIIVSVPVVYDDDDDDDDDRFRLVHAMIGGTKHFSIVIHI